MTSTVASPWIATGLPRTLSGVCTLAQTGTTPSLTSSIVSTVGGLAADTIVFTIASAASGASQNALVFTCTSAGGVGLAAQPAAISVISNTAVSNINSQATTASTYTTVQKLTAVDGDPNTLSAGAVPTTMTLKATPTTAGATTFTFQAFGHTAIWSSAGTLSGLCTANNGGSLTVSGSTVTSTDNIAIVVTDSAAADTEITFLCTGTLSANAASATATTWSAVSGKDAQNIAHASGYTTTAAVVVASVDVNTQVVNAATPFTFTTSGGTLASDGSNKPYIKFTVTGGAAGDAGVVGWRDGSTPAHGVPCVYASGTECTVTSTATVVATGNLGWYATAKAGTYVRIGSVTSDVAAAVVVVSTVDIATQVAAAATVFTFTVTGGPINSDGSNDPYIKMTAASTLGTAAGVVGWADTTTNTYGVKCLFYEAQKCRVTSTATVKAAANKVWYSPTKTGTYVALTTDNPSAVTVAAVVVASFTPATQVESVATTFTFTITGGPISADGSNKPYIKMTVADDGTAVGVAGWVGSTDTQGVACVYATALTCTVSSTATVVAAANLAWYSVTESGTYVDIGSPQETSAVTSAATPASTENRYDPSWMSTHWGWIVGGAAFALMTCIVLTGAPIEGPLGGPRFPKDGGTYAPVRRL